jgi:hypothetical protein
MKPYSYRLNGNYYVALDTLNQKLKEISHGAHQWMAVPVLGIFLSPGQQNRSCVLIGYSNPDGTSLLNHLCYMFPAVALAGYSPREAKLVVQLSPGSMPALSRGLYWDEGSLKIDPMEDFFRVWIPVKRCLGLLNGETSRATKEANHEFEPEQGVRPVDEVACREALYRHLDWLSYCTEMIQNAVSEDIDSEEFVERIAKMCRCNRRNE